MIVTVTPNPAVDLTYRLDALALGEASHVAAPTSRAGGKGLNVARVLTQTGRESVAVTTVGGASGAEFQAELAASGVPHRLVPVAHATRRSIALVEDVGDRTTVLNETGHPLSEAELAALLDAVDAELAGGASCLVGSGSLPPGAPDGLYAELVRRAHAAGVAAIVDAVGPALLAAAAAGAELLAPNLAELRRSTGTADPVSGARALLEAGAGLVVVTLGEDGMLAVPREGEPLRARLGRRLAGNPTGAGDAAAAAFACGPADPLEVLLTRAVAWSAAAVLAPVAGELHESHPELAGDVLIEKEDR